MEIDLTHVLMGGYVIIQLAAVHFSYEIYRFNRLHNQWLAVTVALILMACQGAFALIFELGYLRNLAGLVSVLNRVTLPLIISLFLLAGLWSMKRNFEKFEVIHQTTCEKLRQFNQAGEDGGGIK
jgi:uncharacterized membrane protein